MLGPLNQVSSCHVSRYVPLVEPWQRWRRKPGAQKRSSSRLRRSTPVLAVQSVMKSSCRDHASTVTTLQPFNPSR